MSTLSKKESYFFSLIQKIKKEASVLAKASSILIKKGLREVKTSVLRKEVKVILYSANTNPKDLFKDLLAKVGEEVIIIKFANSSSISKAFGVDFPINIAALNTIPTSDSLNIVQFRNNYE